MSQAKVDRQKEYKKNRKQIIAKQKRKNRLARAVGYLCVLCFVVLVGFSVYKKVNPTPEADNTAFYKLIATDSYGILQPALSE